MFPSGFTAVDPIGEGAEFVVPSPVTTGHRFSRSRPCLSRALGGREGEREGGREGGREGEREGGKRERGREGEREREGE